MKLIIFLVLAICYYVRASVIPVHTLPTTYAVTAGTPVVTAHSHQVVARQFNRVYVPTVPTVSTVPTVAYPGYSATWSTYPYIHRYGYGYGYGYPYSYTYPYSTTVW
ncbi:uncharacterized protein LOC101888076 [Musca domestica]|uniref:Uncharacterized protein LOC101888076 n=1 Tax=Musca domestica TaxID=7370 RepID=A0A1I8MJB2_MUSDO|nr:uncharacterized protein LOC101888076 [Musca domestica]